jgi:hypothetical protein
MKSPDWYRQQSARAEAEYQRGLGPADSARTDILGTKNLPVSAHRFGTGYDYQTRPCAYTGGCFVS